VVSQVSSCNHFALIVPCYHQIRISTPPPWCPFIFYPCHFDLALNFVYPSCSVIQKNVISDRAEDQFILEVLTPMGFVVLEVGI
jgi:hypothetical protein